MAVSARPTGAGVGTHMPGNLGVVDQGPDVPQRGDAGRPQTVQAGLDVRRRLEQAWARSQELMDQIEKGRSERELLRDSVIARLSARLASMPVIEQAKGVLMAQQRCGPDAAFELLRRASQRANVKVSVLAAQIVEQVSAPPPDGSAERPRAVAHGKS
jgi:ANTAR domain